MTTPCPEFLAYLTETWGTKILHMQTGTGLTLSPSVTWLKLIRVKYLKVGESCRLKVLCIHFFLSTARDTSLSGRGYWQQKNYC